MRDMKRWYPGLAMFVGCGLACSIGCGSSAPAVTVPAPSPVVKSDTTAPRPPPVPGRPPPPVVKSAPPAPRPPTKPDGLVPPEPTLRLPRNFLPTGYAARLAIDPSQAGVEGAIQITGNVSEKSLVVWLNEG